MCGIGWRRHDAGAYELIARPIRHVYDRTMNNLLLFAGAGICIALCAMRARYLIARLSRERVLAQLDAARYRRHAERLAMVLQQADPDQLAHTRARSDMEWQQAVKGLEDGQLPVFFPLEPSFIPVAALRRADSSGKASA
jgi:hypothetical protein